MTELDEAADIRTESAPRTRPEVGSDARRGILGIDPIHFPTTVGEFDHRPDRRRGAGDLDRDR